VVDGGGATVLAKIEGRHPAYSVKCRIGAAMVWMPKSAACSPRQGIGGADQRQYRNRAGLRGGRQGLSITLTMPETMSLERRKVLAAFGAKLVLDGKARWA